MRATAILSLLFALVLSCAAVSAGENTAPITQAEIDAYLNLISQIDENTVDENVIFQLYQKSGLTPERFQIIGGRIMASYMLANGATIDMLKNQMGMPPEVEPSDAEMELINKNMDAIMGAMGGGM